MAGRVPATNQGYPSYPDLAVEVWSSQSDLGDANKLKKARAKLQIYLKAGTRIAWGINPEKLEVEVYYKDPARPSKVLIVWNELDGEDLIPGFRLSLKDLFGR